MARASSRPPSSGAGTNLALGALLTSVVVAIVLYGAGALAIAISGHHVPGGRPLAGITALAHVRDPAVAWRCAVGSPAAYWLVSALVVAVLAGAATTLAVLVRRRSARVAARPRAIDAVAGRDEVRRAAGRRALLARGAQLRPSIARATPADLGYELGRSRGVACYMSVEDSAVVLGPPRSGKGLHLVIPMILDAPGAVLTTSTRPDNLTTTLAARAANGRPVAVFDPQGLARGLPSSTRWSPIRGCEVPQVAMIRARALCADAGRGTENGNFWAQQTIGAVRCLLHAAALGERDPIDLYRWSLSPVAAREAVAILIEHDGAAEAWEHALDAVISADARQRDSIWAMVANAFAALADPDVLAAVSPGRNEQFDPVAFLTGRGTLYLLGTASGAAATSGLVGAFVEDIVETARRLAASSPGARLDPPLALVLDEAANYELPSLASLVSEGGGTGITTVAVLQSLAQARDRWGRDAAQAIWDSAITKVVLGGGSNAEDLADLSRLIGEHETPERSESWGGDRASHSVSVAHRRHPILSADELRRLAFGTALLLCRAAPPILLELRPWSARRDAAALVTQRREAEQLMQRARAEMNASRSPRSTPATRRPAPGQDGRVPRDGEDGNDSGGESATAPTISSDSADVVYEDHP